MTWTSPDTGVVDQSNLEPQPYCEEYTFALPFVEQDLEKLNDLMPVIGLKPIDRASFEVFKQINGLIDDRTVDKIRTSYTYNDFTLAVDEVANLGIFLEIELMAESTEDLANTTKAMEQSLSHVSLKPLTTGYTTLLLRKRILPAIYRVDLFLKKIKNIGRVSGPQPPERYRTVSPAARCKGARGKSQRIYGCTQILEYFVY